MRDITLNPGDHLGIVKPDERQRFALKSWVTREPGTSFRVYSLDEGRTIVLEAVDG